MKPVAIFFLVVTMLSTPLVLAQESMQSMAGEQSMVTMYSCSMDGYVSKAPGNCPLCGMKLSEKQMTESEAKTAIEKSKSE